MSICCQELFALPSLKSLKLIAGKEGLDRNIRWVYAAEVIEDVTELTQWLHGGELVIITGIGIRNKEAVFIELMEKIHEKNLAGLIVCIGPYIEKIPTSVIELANTFNIPLFTLPWEVPLVEVTQDICTYLIHRERQCNEVEQFLQQILFLEGENSKSLKEQAALIGHDFDQSHRVIVIKLDNFASFIKDNQMKESTVIAFKKEFQQIIENFLKDTYKGFSLFVNDAIIMLVNGEIFDKQMLRTTLSLLQEKIQQGIGLTASIGIGTKYNQLSQYRKSMEEARQALKVSNQKNHKNEIIFYEEMGIFSLLGEVENLKVLKKIHKRMLIPLYEYDKINETHLVETLKRFLENSKNMHATAKQLFIHRNTLKYRLEKIEQLTGYALNNQEDCFHFQLAYYIHDFFKE
ncbi:PucR C-terminal helix-turn-helix domain-containing protein [Anaerovirgula multivorans]|uniref:PucR C-terminal helix-turn-helix domain-containing protein n=1 Tax=Anaerovirgula multivorans TaxID=312168 RepID=A0A239J1R6_9FIRM|nr:PucR family transcriptional regulator [Anaerovirgula multivorans]SNS98594.1 PucR C-terminal helix-turn-helix domain-containing protein [Anaerovirgula multivorans]